MPVRIVADPNIWVSALTSPYGAPAAVLRAVLTGEVTVVVSSHLLDELGRVLARSKFRRWVSQEDAVAFVGALAMRAELHPDLPIPSYRGSDADDAYLIALAETADAILVTGDKDLLDLEMNPPAITPREFVELLERHRQT